MKKLYLAALAALTVGTMSFMHAGRLQDLMAQSEHMVNLDDYGLVKYYLEADKKFEEKGKTPSEAFREICNGIKEDKKVFPAQMVMNSLNDLMILKPRI